MLTIRGAFDESYTLGYAGHLSREIFIDGNRNAILGGNPMAKAKLKFFNLIALMGISVSAAVSSLSIHCVPEPQRPQVVSQQGQPEEIIAHAIDLVQFCAKTLELRLEKFLSTQDPICYDDHIKEFGDIVNIAGIQVVRCLEAHNSASRSNKSFGPIYADISSVMKNLHKILKALFDALEVSSVTRMLPGGAKMIGIKLVMKKTEILKLLNSVASTTRNLKDKLTKLNLSDSAAKVSKLNGDLGLLLRTLQSGGGNNDAILAALNHRINASLKLAGSNQQRIFAQEKATILAMIQKLA